MTRPPRFVSLSTAMKARQGTAIDEATPLSLPIGVSRYIIKSNQIISLFAQNERSEKIDDNSGNEQDSNAQEALAAALVNNSNISTRNS